MTKTRLARLRAESGLTQMEVAAMTGLRQSKISDIERGRRNNAKIPLETAAKLAAALDVHAEDLLDEETITEINDTARKTGPAWTETHRVKRRLKSGIRLTAAAAETLRQSLRSASASPFSVKIPQSVCVGYTWSPNQCRSWTWCSA